MPNPPPPDHGIDIREEAGVRYLHFGSSWVQGAMRIARPWALELAYTREMMACLLFHSSQDWPRNALLIGLGAASLVRFLYRHLPQCRMTVVEIHPGVVAVARQFFKLPEDPERLRTIIGDGADIVGDRHDHYDLILIDGFDAQARSGRLNSHRFYADCRQNLADKGILVCNLLGRNRGFQASVDRLRLAFDGRAIVFPSCDSGNAVAFASPTPLSIPLDDLRERAQSLKTATGLNLGPCISRLQLTQSLPGNCLRL
ncbi:MAG: Spermidine synthase [Betaproteobacteria bacterium ADurb.Bin341]|nr:MAG: Spermidine synthase [Betaproteobacteria bacterium ADurb.Bin341]